MPKFHIATVHGVLHVVCVNQLWASFACPTSNFYQPTRLRYGTDGRQRTSLTGMAHLCATSITLPNDPSATTNNGYRRHIVASTNRTTGTYARSLEERTNREPSWSTHLASCRVNTKGNWNRFRAPCGACFSLTKELPMTPIQ